MPTASPTAPASVSDLLRAAGDGDPEAFDALLPLVYDQLHGIARHQRRRWHGDATLNTTALVHEAYLKLVGGGPASWHDRAHFLAVAARAMRHILIDYAKQRKRQKRGGDLQRVSLGGAVGSDDASPLLSLERADQLVHLDAALDRLAARSDRHCRIVECRFFAGMTIDETAHALGVSPATVKRGWSLAQSWLYRELEGDREADE